MQSLLILGRQPALGLAELESLYGAAALQLVSDHPGKNGDRVQASAALLDLDPADVDFDRLGGSLKLCRVLTTLDSTNWGDVETYLLQSAPKQAAQLEDGKLKLGISAYGLRVTPQRIQATGLSLKKALRQSGRSVRLIPNSEPALNSASVLHNNLTGPLGWEFVFVRNGNRTIVGQTIAEQDIDSYAVRDRDRPKRDARVGMLPPKLAQIIINLAVSNHLPSPDFEILDPFCGTGVVVQEAWLMGFSAMGSDIDPRMGEYTSENLNWLHKRFPRTFDVYGGWQLGDATSTEWEDDKAILKDGEVDDIEMIPLRIDAVASETYLGKPFTSQPSNEVLNQTVSECNLIIKKFLGNIHGQMKRSTRLCLAVPAWQVGRGRFKHLPLLDSLRDIGYNRISFEHVRTEDLIYYRADQIVARELLVLQKL